MKHLFTAFLLFTTTFVFAQKNTWNPVEKNRVPLVQNPETDIVPQQFRVFQINFATLKQQLAAAPMRFSTAAQNNIVTVEIPMPDGSMELFSLQEAPTMHPDLQAKFPSIRSFAGVGVTDRQATMRCEYSQNGFSAMIFGKEDIVYIDPFSKGNTEFYTVYYKKDFSTDKKMECKTTGSVEQSVENEVLRTGDGKLRTYRLALACTAEYTTYQGGTLAGSMAAMNKTMTRVNGVYEKEFSITMVLVPNNDQLIFLDSPTDGYSHSSVSTMLGENQTKCDAVIGIANYDIGHVFDTAGGGIAQLESPCKAGSKARGVTGLSKPLSDPFDIDYVCHEMGHQYGSGHTFNNSCANNISIDMSYEPGSGSTIMGYAGICSPNVQNNSDDYFHLSSLLEINAYTNFGTGNSCPSKTNSGNVAAPIVKGGLDYTIPKSTPFELIGTATDADNDPLTYCWEQYDKEISSQSPKSTATNGPSFRSLKPKTTAVRVFPNLDNLTKNTNATWEVLPSVARVLNFRLTARDIHDGFGRAQHDAIKLTVDAATGPFVVTAPNTAVTWQVLQKQTVTWNVAKTDTFPINAAKVNILFSSDGGYTFPDTLAKEVANNGTYQITVPNKISSKCRIKVKGANNVFFDMSNVDFKVVLPPSPIFIIDATSTSAAVCKKNTDSVSFNIAFTSVAGFNEKLQLSASNLPIGALLKFSQDTFTPSKTIKVTITKLKIAAIGTFPIKIKAIGATKKDSLIFTLSNYSTAPIASKGLAPIDVQNIAIKNTKLTWKKTPNTTDYFVETSKDFLFNTIDESAAVTDTFFLPTKLQFSQVYYWRVTARNTCADGNVSPTYAFQTKGQFCNTFNGAGNFTIPTSQAINQTLDAVVSNSGVVSDVDVTINATHTYLEDLVLTLENPSGKKAILIDAQCGDNENIAATFDDNGVVVSCASTKPSIKGIVQPLQPLSVFNNLASNGIWKLRVQDVEAAGDGGILQSWNVKICSEGVITNTLALEKNTFTTVEGTSKSINNVFLNSMATGVSPSDITYLITKLPTQGTLRRGSTPLALGATLTQQEVSSGLLIYFNNTGSSSQDSFFFALSASNKAWIPSQVFPIKVLNSSLLSVSSILTKKISCFNTNDAQISFDVLGGQKPYLYSINNGANFDTAKVFSNLAAGTYITTVKDAQGIVKKADTIQVLSPTALTIAGVKDSSNLFLKVAGGTAPYLIDINNKGFGKNDTLLAVPNGKYVFTAKDANACVVKDSVTFFVNTLKISALLNKSIKCNNENNAEIIVNVSGGKTPFTYQINNGALQNSNIFTGLSAGKYEVIVKDAEGFLKKADSVTVVNPSKIKAIIKVIKDSVFVDGSGGTGLLQYRLTGNFSDVNTFTKLSKGVYVLTIKDQNACTEMFDVVVDFVPTQDLANELGVQISPNPANDIVNIHLSNAVAAPVNVRLYDMQGKLVVVEKILLNTFDKALITSVLPEGLYQLVLTQLGKTASFKVSVLH